MADAPLVLGIDPGSYVAGYGLLRASLRPEYLQCGVLRMPKERPLNDRIALVCADVSEILDEFDVAALAIERAFLGEHPQAAIVLSEVRGALKGFALARGLRVLEFAPSTVKRAATGRGQSTKPEVRAAVMRRFAIETPPPLDASDGLAVALCGALELARRPTAPALGASPRSLAGVRSASPRGTRRPRRTGAGDASGP